MIDVLGHPEWRDDPRFANGRTRMENRQALTDCSNAALSSGTRAHWEAALIKAGVPVGPVQTVGEALSHPQSVRWTW